MMVRLTIKLMLLGGTLIIGTQTAQAQTCASQPTCSELGYTLTSTSDCVGAVLKCPFDKSKFYCTQKSEVTAAVMPDYGSAVTLYANVTYTVGSSSLSTYSCGWASFNVTAGSGSCYIYINEKTVSKITVDVSMMIPVLTSDSFKLSSGCGTASVTFYPCKKY